MPIPLGWPLRDRLRVTQPAVCKSLMQPEFLAFGEVPITAAIWASALSWRAVHAHHWLGRQLRRSDVADIQTRDSSRKSR
jgi:hypothetical protein